MSRPRRAGRWLAGGVLLGALAFGAAPGVAAESTGLGEALRHLGRPGFLWGRLAVEEESPQGAWTPLVGVEVRFYPAVPALVAELERIRESTRRSATEFDSAVARVEAALARYQTEADGVVRAAVLAAEAGRGQPRPDATDDDRRANREREARETASPIRRQVTDANGIFVVPALPSGDWLVVVIHVRPVAGALPAPKTRRTPDATPFFGPRFLPDNRPPIKDAEIWVQPVHVPAGARVAIKLTDRMRWLAGPVR